MKKFLMLGLISLFLALSFTPVSANEEVRIFSYDIDLEINENGLIKVEQKLDVEFYVPSRGIYAYIPQSYAMVWDIDGQSIQKNYYFPVRNIKVDNDQFVVETDSFDNVLIRIGDPDVTFTGPKTYVYRYTLQLRDLDLDGIQALYYNLVGDGWSIPMNEVNFRIVLPDSWPSQVEFYTGLYGSTDNAEVDISIDGNVLTGSYTKGLMPYQALTIYAPLPNDFFTFILPTDFSWLILAFALAFSLLIFVLFKKYGEDEIPVDTVEFNPIDGLSSAQVGYIFDGTVDTKDILSLFIEWAYKGYLKIIEDEDLKGFTLVKLKDIPDHEIRAEKILFNKVFESGDEVTDDDLKFKFHSSMTHAQAGIQQYFARAKDRHIFSQKATVIKVLLGIVHLVPVMLLILNLNYRLTYRFGLSIVYAILLYVFGSLISLAIIVLVKRWTAMKKVLRIFPIAGIGLMSAIFLALYYALSVTIQMSTLQYAISVALMFFNIGFISVMDKRTSLGTQYYGKILGLRNFIESAEKERLELLVHDDPSYFFKILPYAYVLNISNVWSKKFESIVMPEPEWYVSQRPFTPVLFMRNMNRTMGSMQSAMTSVPAQSGRGGGGFGGGGGGFSGGGFGGGGGGRW